MKRHGLIMALALVLIVNGFVLAGVLWNRSGQPEAVIELTEREVSTPYYHGQYGSENTGLSLHLQWNRFDSPFDEEIRIHRPHVWFDQSKLEAVGFKCDLPLSSGKAKDHYGKMLPRKTYAVLSLEGKEWEAWLLRRKEEFDDLTRRFESGAAPKVDLKTAKQVYENDLKWHSRLFAVDVGNEPVRLREKYADRKRYFITPAEVRLQFDDSEGKGPRLTGLITKLLIESIHVPKAKSGLLQEYLKRDGEKSKRSPSYKVILHYGKRYEPWVADIQPLT